MHPEWRNFLHQQGAVSDENHVAHFGNPEAELRAAERGIMLADLSGMEGLIAVTGPDRHSFLQGQLSTDMPALTPTLSQLSSWSNAKGRVVTALRVIERGDSILLALPLALTVTVLKRLSMYVLRAKAKLMDAGDTLARFGLGGDKAPELLAACELSAPAKINAVTENRGVQAIRLHGQTPRFAVYGKAAQLEPVWTTLVGKGARPVGNDAWALLRILAGEPSVHPETSEHFVAQMLGLEELGAINFRKGCYLGQEVIARAHYRGAVKRHLHRARCASSAPILAGTAVHAENANQPVAEVVDACRDADGMWQMLIVLQDEFADAPLQISGSDVHTIVGAASRRD